ncbi:MAG: C13 family peptidase [Betaproteobacteria bacterium]
MTATIAIVRTTFANLLRNLRSGLRLAFFRPVERLAFRIDLPQVLLLFGVSALIDVIGDALRIDDPRVFSLFGAGSEFYAAALLLFTAALIALINRQRDLALAIPVLVLASMPVVQIVHYALVIMAVNPAGLVVATLFDNAVILWIVIVLIRCVAVAFSPPPVHAWLRSIGAGLLLASPIWFANTLFPNMPWWQDDIPVAQNGGLNAGSEAVLATQSYLLNRVLDDLQEERPGRADLYFVGFAPYGAENVFRKDVDAAQKVMDARWGTAGRSVVLVNNPQTLITAPFATVTNLRETLNEIGNIIDPDDDVVMVYLASHGSADFRLAASQPPLSLVELTPAGLKQLLDDAGIKWRIIVVSACYSGGYIAPLKNDNTLIITASQADRTSFGCGNRSEATYFGEAFFQQGLAGSDSIEAAFDIARTKVEAKEKAQGLNPPSDPQIDMGSEMAEKLKSLGKRGTSGATVRVFRPPSTG